MALFVVFCAGFQNDIFPCVLSRTNISRMVESGSRGIMMGKMMRLFLECKI